MMKRLALTVLLVTTPALAQAPQAQLSPAQVALQINNVVAQWAQQLEADKHTIKDLQEQLAAVMRERDELKAKAVSSK
jgi:ABC-type transporter MlaC component